VVVAYVHLPYRPATLCVVRGLTGIPCPFCGGTTAAVQAGRGDAVAALRASPLAVIGTPMAAVWPLLSTAAARVPSSIKLGSLLAALAGSELWQLHRFGWI
jgi:hypothetical protein